MNNKKLQEELKKYPDDKEVYFVESNPIGYILINDHPAVPIHGVGIQEDRDKEFVVLS